MKFYWISITLLLSLLLGGCGSSKPISSTSLPVSPTQGDNSQTTPFPPAPSSLEGWIEKAKEDLAQRLSIPISDIVLVDAKEVTWSDASLGCPQPDMLYAQVLTPGYLVKLKYDFREFEYHAGKDRSLTYCENPLPPVEGAASDT